MIDPAIIDFPTTEQQAIIENTARIRIVRAVPGSGKTWLVAQVIRQELDHWPINGSGIAALSFTHVGSDEIHKAVGYSLEHPHFIGTIDAFIFRYVVRPFLRRCFPWFSSPRLIAGEWGAKHWSKYGPNQITTVCNGTISLFDCVYIDEEEGKAVVAHKPHPMQPLKQIIDDQLDTVREGKMNVWKNYGYLTHSDVALWASQILSHPIYGSIVRAEINRRFPLVIVDELQDTGYFLGKSIRLLLGEGIVRGVLVGDPDQAIFEFNGARPDLFDGFNTLEGAIELPLANSRRCARSIVNVAKHVKDSAGEIYPSENLDAKAYLLKYTDMTADVSRILKTITERQGSKNIKVIARTNPTVDDLSGRSSKDSQKLGCPPLFHIQRAVIAFRQGHQVAALAAARAALDIAVFEHESVNDEKLNQNGIDPIEWRLLALRCLLSANALDAAGTLHEWQATVGGVLDEQLGKFGLIPSLSFTAGNLKPQKRGEWEKPSADYLPYSGVVDTSLAGLKAQTIHSVKGETHDITVFVCPKVKPQKCPSTIWWSTDIKDREEKRIAYVAMTRTQGDLIVCVSNDCYERLAAIRPQFVNSFECKTVDEYIAEFDKSENLKVRHSL